MLPSDYVFVRMPRDLHEVLRHESFRAGHWLGTGVHLVRRDSKGGGMVSLLVDRGADVPWYLGEVPESVFWRGVKALRRNGGLSPIGEIGDAEAAIRAFWRKVRLAGEAIAWEREQRSLTAAPVPTAREWAEDLFVPEFGNEEGIVEIEV